MTLSEFLLARVAEDEAVAEVFAWAKPEHYETTDDVEASPEYVTLYVAPDRWLAECEAKRVVIEDAWAKEVEIDGEWGYSRSREQMEAEGANPDALRALAAVYADHPDYEEAWRP